MASKRAVQLLSLRTSYVILRSQCAPAPPRITSQALSRVIPSSRTPFGLGQRRWESNAAGNTTATASKVYEFEDVRTAFASPPPRTKTKTKDTRKNTRLHTLAKHTANTPFRFRNFPLTPPHPLRPRPS
ncbi:hypothetical protein K504DRAFT_131923 [Pleomassaria siparia CBS 279.74]|uniref:Uncharacterized protein n=1 Tax=Pleomassaria siparia CBS 279.74 TaxID=1314801 RepID=A0A6G1KJY9_9PLEO|nr:hypothetical protein K504DRAFT_131923 [Pleomassaria siparia CBS 279.74]